MRTPRRTNLKIQISRSSLRCTKSALVGARPHSLFKSSDSNVVYVLVTNGNAFTWCCTCVCSRFSRVWLFMTLSTGARQDPLSTGFPRQEYWSGLPFPSSGDLLDPKIKPMSLALESGFFTTKEAWGHYAKRNNFSDRERHTAWSQLHMQLKKNKLIETESKSVVARGRGGEKRNEWRCSRGTKFWS